LDPQRNPDILNRLKMNSLIEDIRLYQKSWLNHLEITDRNPLPELAFNVNLGDDGMLEDPGRDGKIKDTLSFRSTSLKT
jgi:hypothetical protein